MEFTNASAESFSILGLENSSEKGNAEGEKAAINDDSDQTIGNDKDSTVSQSDDADSPEDEDKPAEKTVE